MKLTLPVLLLILSVSTKAQTEYKTAAKWSPGGLFFGNISLYGEHKIGTRSSVTAKLGIPVSVNYSPSYDGNDADLNSNTFSFLAGYRLYASKRNFRGFYFEPFFKYVQHKTSGFGNGDINGDAVVMQITNDYSGAGIGAELGVQFLIAKRFVIDVFFFGPEINIASNNFKATEISNSLQWNATEAQEAEQDIRNFIDDFPFIRNKVDVKVSNETKTVTADFDGTLPGYRAGISFGFIF